jgi:hypothetical protein
MEPGSNFEKYVNVISQYPDSSFDIISVDGRSRNACIRAALKKLRPGGMLILDNSERLQYAQSFDVLSDFGVRMSFAGCGPYNRYFWETTIFIKNQYA